MAIVLITDSGVGSLAGRTARETYCGEDGRRYRDGEDKTDNF